MQPQQLNDRIRIPGVAEIITDRGGLAALWIQGSDASQGTAATIYLHGAHVASFHPHGGEELLWLSQKSHWMPDKPIRGGVPLCFPWFGPNAANPTLPAPGFARTRPWTLHSVEKNAEGGVSATLQLDSTTATRAFWPYTFTLLHRITVGRDLRMALEMHNHGKTPFTFEEAQHTYFAVGDVRQLAVKGLAGAAYIDKVDGQKQKRQEGDIAIAAETDRVYLDTAAPITIEDPLKRRRITVRKENSNTTVVWNPWIAKAKAMADFGDEEWPGMLCVETCNVGPAAVTLAPGQSHLMTTQIQVHPL
jgi:glucose-6-phosphate 1-epimerase